MKADEKDTNPRNCIQILFLSVYLRIGGVALGIEGGILRLHPPWSVFKLIFENGGADINDARERFSLLILRYSGKVRVPWHYPLRLQVRLLCIQERTSRPATTLRTK